MNRIEENKELIDIITNENKKTLIFEEQGFFLLQITDVLIDISKSLAIIADSVCKKESEVKE